MVMAQCGVFNNCNGSCKFCLIKDEEFFSLEDIYVELDRVKDNILFIAQQEDNWTTKFNIDVIIEEVLLKSPNPNVRFSTVSNGYYDPEWLLFPVMDKIDKAVGIRHVDMNFSYDFKYRFNNEAHEKRVRDTINAFHERYNYVCGVQMIMTQQVVDMINEGWLPKDLIDERLPGNQLTFLYPHPICRGNGFTGAQNLEGFNFTRPTFLKAIARLKKDDYKTYESFYWSTHNSATYKYTMLYEKKENASAEQTPILCGGKEVINEDCGHSVLYQCYSDTERCMLCDLDAIGL